jgi:hypothetical protein
VVAVAVVLARRASGVRSELVAAGHRAEAEAPWVESHQVKTVFYLEGLQQASSTSVLQLADWMKARAPVVWISPANRVRQALEELSEAQLVAVWVLMLLEARDQSDKKNLSPPLCQCRRGSSA